MLIDGKLVDSEGGATFDNVNPATEEVLGVVADGTARRHGGAPSPPPAGPFDTTSWATDHAFRKQCLYQLQAALEAEQEELRAELVAEVGCPVLLTYGPQLDVPAARGADLAGRSDRRRSRGARSLGAEGRLRPGRPPSARCGRSRSASSA